MELLISLLAVGAAAGGALLVAANGLGLPICPALGIEEVQQGVALLPLCDRFGVGTHRQAFPRADPASDVVGLALADFFSGGDEPPTDIGDLRADQVGHPGHRQTLVIHCASFFLKSVGLISEEIVA